MRISHLYHYYYANQAAGLQALSLGDVVSFTSGEARATGQANILIFPKLLYNDGKSYLVYQTPTLGSLNIISYDENYGVSKPIRFYPKQSPPFDSHHSPAAFIDNSTLYIPVEIQHGVQPINIYKARNANDDLSFELSATTIGTIPTYPNISKKNGVLINLGQTSDIEAAFNKNSSGDFEGAWAVEALIATRAANEDEHYISAVLNNNAITDKIVFVISGRNDDVIPLGIWFRKYLVKAEITAGGVTYYNWDESFSKSSRLTAAELNDNFLYYTTGADTVNAYIPVPALDGSGNFYDITYDGTSAYHLIYWPAGQASPTVKEITLPGTPTILTSNDIGGDSTDQNGGCMMLIATTTALYAFFRIQSGLYGKPFMYKSTNQGDTWTDEGDVFTGVDLDFKGLIGPSNLPANNRNFIIAGLPIEDPNYSPLYIRKAAFGTVQAESGDPFNVTAYTESEYNALMVRSYFVEAGKISNTGTGCTGLTDQSPSAQNATVSGSPTLDSATTPTYATLDGVNDAFSIPITGLTALTEGMIIVVAKAADGANRNFLTASKNTVTNKYLTYGKSSTNKTRFTSDLGTVEMFGHETVTDAFHIFVFLHQNGASTDVLHFFDGALQDRVVGTGDSSEGSFFGPIATLTNIEVGRLVRTTTAWYGFDLKHVAISDTPFSYEQLRKSLKYLSNKYSITLNSHFQ